jgi:hypothetical protein
MFLVSPVAGASLVTAQVNVRRVMATRGPKVIDPTPQEIETRTRRIRADWSERTHRIRSGWSVEAADRMDQWIAPLVHLSDLGHEEVDFDDRYWTN